MLRTVLLTPKLDLIAFVCATTASRPVMIYSTACGAASSGPNLSAGAIAGISVAAVVVVGGLVGFLCWWFICRGKA